MDGPRDERASAARTRAAAPSSSRPVRPLPIATSVSATSTACNLHPDDREQQP